MSFTFTNYAGLPVQHPFRDLVSSIMSGAREGINLKYLPKEKESQIFTNQLGPLATLATSPMYLQNPQFQQALSNLIAKNSSLLGPGFERIGNAGGGGNYAPTYAEQIQNQADETQDLAESLSHAGKAQTGISSGAGWLESHFGDLGKTLVDYFGKGKINSQLAQQENQFNTNLLGLKKKAVDVGMLNQRDADDIFRQRENETPKQTMARVRKTVPALFQQNDYNPGSIEAKIARDNQERYQYNQGIGEASGANPGETLLQGPDGSRGFVPSDQAAKLIATGKFKEVK